MFWKVFEKVHHSTDGIYLFGEAGESDCRPAWALTTLQEPSPTLELWGTAHYPHGFFSFPGSSFVGTTCWREPSIRWWPILGKNSSETSSTSPLLERRGERPLVLCRHLSVCGPEPLDFGWFFSRRKQGGSKPLPQDDSDHVLPGRLSVSRYCQALGFMFFKSLKLLTGTRVWGTWSKYKPKIHPKLLDLYFFTWCTLSSIWSKTSPSQSAHMSIQLHTKFSISFQCFHVKPS